MRPFPRSPALLAGSAVALLALAGAGLSQLVPGDRGVAPIDSSSNFEVTGVSVDVSAKGAEQARTAAWREAQRRGWAMLWGRAHGLDPKAAPRLLDGTLDSMVAGIEVEEEHAGPTRYIARLGVLFDRGRTIGLLGVAGAAPRSPPTLVIPVEWDGGTLLSLEQRTDWQKAWARFRSGGSVMDYIRPIGTGADPLLLNAAQTGRPGRAWWRMLLDQYAANDVVIPIVRLERQWPGGPVTADFEARHGVDGQVVTRFTLHVNSSDELPRMLDEGVRRIDEAYADALRLGALGADPSLLAPPPAAAPEEANVSEDEPVTEGETAAAPSATLTLQVDTPDSGAPAGVEAALGSIPGVSQVRAVSLAIGGISLYQIAYQGDPALLRTALAARGWRAEGEGATLQLSRRPVVAPPPEVTGGGEAPPQ